jgi:drug/metabolite transporter (DMT)-like permease
MTARTWLHLFVLSLLWGATFFFAAVALKELPPLTLVFSRVAIAAMILVPVALVAGYRFPGAVSGWKPFIGMAILNNILPFSLIFAGQTRIASGLAAVLNAATPLSTLLIARLFGGETLIASKVAGVLVGLVGVAILIGPDAMGAGNTDVLGMLLVLAGTVSYGFSALWGKRLRGTPPLLSSAAQLTCSSLILLPVAGLYDRIWALTLPTTPAILAVLALAMLSTALAYVIFFRILVESGPQDANLVTLLIPPSAIALGVIVLGETLSMRQIIGALVIASGLLVIDGRLLARFVPPAGAPKS